MRATLLGVRGSTPAPGPEFVRYGGHTSCVALTAQDADVPSLVLDAGTGLRTLTKILDGAPFRGSILLSHLHWDHMMGLPFFAAGDRDDARVELLLPAQEGQRARDLLAQALAPPAFPITPEGLRGVWQFDTVASGSHRVVEGFAVSAVSVEHKGGATLAYRISDSYGSLAYLPDHMPSAGVSAELRELLAGVDVLIHDAQFHEAERAVAVAYGHATVDEAVHLARDCGVGSLVLFHHGPERSDDALDAMADCLRPRATELCIPISVARQGDVLRVTRATGR